MKIGNFCHIVKDPIEIDLYYAVIQRKYDGKDEWSIIASGNTETETMQNLIIKIFNTYKNCIGKICQIGKSISENEIFIAAESLKFSSQDIEKKSPTDETTIESFDAMHYDEDEDVWTRLYR